MWILAQILTEITGTPRTKVIPGVDFQWSKDSWTHNIFRVYELIFWRRCSSKNPKDTIRHESSSAAWHEDGKLKQAYFCHTWESLFSFLEGKVRSFFSIKWTPFKIYIPVLQTPQGIPVFVSPYLFAIAFDAASGETAQSTLTTVSATHTISGSNTILFCYLVDQAGGTTNVTGATFNSNAMTSINSATNAPSNDGSSYLFYQVSPTSGAHTLQGNRTTATNAFILGGSSYTGAKQTGQPDAQIAGQDSTSPITGTLTTIADNCWAVMGGYTRTQFPGSAGASSTQRTVNNLGQLLIVDTNAAKTPAGSVSLNITAAGNDNFSFAMASFAPSTGAAATVNLLNLLGVGV